ncbi:MAG: hypothetical protein ACLRWH_01440 [Emergencia sp.]
MKREEKIVKKVYLKIEGEEEIEQLIEKVRELGIAIKEVNALLSELTSAGLPELNVEI